MEYTNIIMGNKILTWQEPSFVELFSESKLPENVAKDKEHQQKAKYYKNQQEIKALEEKHAKLTDNANKIQEKANRKNISLKEKLDIEHELAQTKKKLSGIQKDRERLKKTAKGLGYVGAGVIIGTPVYKKAKSLIGG